MPVTHTLVPNLFITGENIEVVPIFLGTLSDGEESTGMIVNPANGILVFNMTDLDSENIPSPINGSVLKINVKSQVDTKSNLQVRVSYDGGSHYFLIADYTITGDNDSSFTFATYNANSENNNTAQLNAEQVNAMQFIIGNDLGIVHDFNVTIDDESGGLIQIADGLVHLREGRIRI